MNDQVQAFGTVAHDRQQAERHAVLRNTYLLLALSLIPSVLGAWIGISTGIYTYFRGIMGMVIFFAGAFGLMYAVEKNKNSAAGVPILLGFTFFMGLMLSSLLASILHFRNGASLIMTAFGGTAGVFFVMASLSTVIKKDLSGMGKWLFWGVVVLIIGSVVNMFVGSTMLSATISTLAIGIFSAYLLYDIKQIMDGGETNYISATLSIYLDLFNIFQSLLSLLGIFGGERD